MRRTAQPTLFAEERGVRMPQCDDDKVHNQADVVTGTCHSARESVGKPSKDRGNLPWDRNGSYITESA